MEFSAKREASYASVDPRRLGLSHQDFIQTQMLRERI